MPKSARRGGRRVNYSLYGGIVMKKAIVFAGGGSKGAYQIGVWKALNELGEQFDIATGTSIGAVNAAFYVQHDFAAAEQMWQNLDASGVMVNGLNFEKSFESIFAQREQLVSFIKTYVSKKGADVTPFLEGLKRYFDADAFFGSDIDYGLMTVKYPSFDPHEVTKAQMAENRENAWEWIAASAAAFPVFPAFEIDGQEYVDGGYFDNVPVATALKLGAQRVTVIDLKTDRVHMGYIRHPWVRYIKPSKDLGTFLNFEKDALAFSMKLGYNDCMKEYGKYYGVNYTFEADDIDFDAVTRAADEFTSLMTDTEARFDFSYAVRVQRVNKLEGCSYILAELAHTEHPKTTDLFFAALECLLSRLGYDDNVNYKLGELLYTLKTRVDGLFPMLEYDTETAFEAVARFFEPVKAEEVIRLKQHDKNRVNIIYMSLIRALQHCNF